MAVSAAPVSHAAELAEVHVDADAEELLDDQARACVSEFSRWVSAHGGEHNLDVRAQRVRRWQSLETPDWLQLLIDIDVSGAAEDALRFWEQASAVLEALVKDHPSPAAELLAEQVHWR